MLLKHRAAGSRDQELGAGNGLRVNLNFEFKIMSLQININFELILELNQNQLLFHLSFLPLSWVGTNQGWFRSANWSSCEITRASKARELETATDRGWGWMVQTSPTELHCEYFSKEKKNKPNKTPATVGFQLMSKLTSFTFCFLGVGWLQQLLGCPGEDSNHCYPSFHWVLFIWSAFFRNPDFDDLHYLHLLIFQAFVFSFNWGKAFLKGWHNLLYVHCSVFYNLHGQVSLP